VHVITFNHISYLDAALSALSHAPVAADQADFKRLQSFLV
jgi:hypothetical protein